MSLEDECIFSRIINLINKFACIFIRLLMSSQLSLTNIAVITISFAYRILLLSKKKKKAHAHSKPPCRGGSAAAGGHGVGYGVGYGVGRSSGGPVGGAWRGGCRWLRPLCRAPFDHAPSAHTTP